MRAWASGGRGASGRGGSRWTGDLGCESRRRRSLAVSVLGLALQAAAPAADVVSLAVPGRANATPWVAAVGIVRRRRVGRSAAGKTDVFVAVSRDGAQTFDCAGPGEHDRRRSAARRRDAAARGAARAWRRAIPRSSCSGRRAARPRRSGPRGRAMAARRSRRRSRCSPRARPAIAAGRRSRSTRTARRTRSGWIIAASPAGRPAGARQPSRRQQRTTAWRWRRSPASTTPRSAGTGITRARARHGRLLLLQDGAGRRRGRARSTPPGVTSIRGNLRDIAFSASRDGGRSFSPPVRVSEDDWAINGCPDDGPAMAVDAAGTVHIVWPTVVGGQTPEGALFYATSRDGRTFSPRVRIPTLGSPKPSHPQIAIDGSGRIVVAWDEAVGGQRVAAMRESPPLRWTGVVRRADDARGARAGRLSGAGAGSVRIRRRVDVRHRRVVRDRRPAGCRCRETGTVPVIEGQSLSTEGQSRRRTGDSPRSFCWEKRR